MKTWILSCAVCGLLFSAARAEEKDAVVKEIDVKGLKLNVEAAQPTKPTAITGAEDLTRAIKDAEIAARIKKDIDFPKTQLVLFTWAGSGQDKITSETKEKKVIFTYTPGKTRDLRQHVHLFAIPKDFTYEIASGR